MEAHNRQSRNPIGIFDSGIGGLTVARAIRKLLPHESIIYFGDTAHLPYGDKAPESIRNYSIRIADFLLSQQCKMIVIACNTASSISYEAVKEHVGNRAFVVDVINPVVDGVTARRSLHKIGVIGTRATIRSRAYPRRIRARNPELKVASLATPLLASMIEEGFFNNSISKTIINDYLSRPGLKGIDTLILACTHYPLIKKEIMEFYGGKIQIVDSAEIVAAKVRTIITRAQILNPSRKANHRFFVSDFTPSFEKSTRIFFGGDVKLTQMNLWK